MKKSIFTIAMAVMALGFTSCESDDNNSNPAEKRAELYVTNGASGNVTAYDFAAEGGVQTSTFTTVSTSNEGVVYNEATNELLVVSRSNDNVTVYGNILAQLTGVTTAITGTASSVDLDSPRAIAVNGNVVVVADNAANELIVYTKNGSNLTLRNTVQVAFPLWAIEFIGNDLYAVVDQSSDLAVFSNFTTNTTNGAVAASKRITIQGIVRTHGLAYDAQDNILVMTDIGSAMDANDGGFHVIPNFTAQFAGVANGGTLGVATQTRVAGAATLLGNPVAVDYDTATNTIYVAEAANGGGRVLAFTNYSAGGNIAPVVNNMLAGANSVYFYGN